MKLPFSKMHGLGNDFMVLNSTDEKIILSSKQVQRLSDRHRGVGFDQLLLIEKSDDPNFDFRYRIFNADGGEVEQCGNGARCAAKFIAEQGLSQKKQWRLQTAKNAIVVRLEENGLVTVDMGQPIFEAAEIPFITDKIAPSYDIDVAGQTHTVAVLSMGNPHAVLLVDNINAAPVAELGAKIEMHPRFPKRVNVGFMQIIHPSSGLTEKDDMQGADERKTGMYKNIPEDFERVCNKADRFLCKSNQIKLRVFERGTGETQACGSGACAAVVAGIRLGLLDEKVLVSLPGGDLTIQWQGDNSSVQMTGPAEFSYEGVVDIS